MPRPRLYASDADRVAAFRERKRIAEKIEYERQAAADRARRIREQHVSGVAAAIASGWLSGNLSGGVLEGHFPDDPVMLHEVSVEISRIVARLSRGW